MKTALVNTKMALDDAAMSIFVPYNSVKCGDIIVNMPVNPIPTAEKRKTGRFSLKHRRKAHHKEVYRTADWVDFWKRQQLQTKKAPVQRFRSGYAVNNSVATQFAGRCVNHRGSTATLR